MTEPVPIYVPPEGDEPLDAVELAIIRVLAPRIARKLRAKLEAEARAHDKHDERDERG